MTLLLKLSGILLFVSLTREAEFITDCAKLRKGEKNASKSLAGSLF